MFEADPNDLTDVRGRIPSEPPHVLRDTTTVRRQSALFQVGTVATTTQLTAAEGEPPNSARALGNASAVLAASLDLRAPSRLATGRAGGPS
jgi:hypothetical protein